MDGKSSRTVWRLRSIAVCSLLTALSFAQEPGMTTVDTKVDLAVNSFGWLSRALHMWNPTSMFGEVQNQAYGYLWPMGPFFALGDWVGLPPWVVQRLWWALLLCVAYTGIVALAARLNIGTPTTRIIAGVAFALSPRILTELGTISVEAWPTALAPWVLVPLIGLAKGASIRRRVVLSALVVGCAGGVNATAVFATVPLALLWMAMLPSFQRRLTAIGAWCLAVACATAWWLVPLLLLGRYSPPFLNYIETASVTTRPTDLTTVLRGASHWLAYLDGPYGPLMSAGFRLVHEPALFAATVAVAAMGVAGLARRGLPHRQFLLAGLLLGSAMVTLGHLSNLDTGLSGIARVFLDGIGAPLRNVHKFDVLLRLPLAMGLAHLLGLFGRAAAFQGRGWHLARRRAVMATAASMAAIAGVATPALAGGVTAPGSYLAVPGYWRDTAAWLNANTGHDHVLVVPSARFPHYHWGSPSDEITQALLESSWGVRNSIPLTPANTIRLLDTIDDVLASGSGSAGLVDLLARNDVRYLLVRSDLNYGKTGTARPIQVRQALARSPGIAMVKSFGPEISGGSILGDYYDYGFGAPARAIEIYAVNRPVSPVGLYDAGSVTTVVGGPESLLELAAAGQLPAAPTMLAGDLGTKRPLGPVAITDGLRRREIAFGRSQDKASATLGADEPWQIPGAAHDYLPSWGPKWTTEARYAGISSITASSSWSQPQPLVGSRPEHLPFAAMDGNPSTSWRTPPGRPAAGQWLQVTLSAPARLTQVTLTFDTQADHYPSKVTVLAGAERVESDVFSGKATVNLGGAFGTRIRVVITEAVSTLRVGHGGVGIAELEIPGVTAERTLKVPAGPAIDRPANIVLSAAPSVGSCFFINGATRCNPSVARGSEDAGRIDRTLTLPASGSYAPAIWARPTPGSDLDSLIDKELAAATPLAVAPSVSASSRGVKDPAGRPGAVIDGDPSTAWYAANGDGNASLRITWLTPRTITGLRLALDPNIAATRPEAITVVGADGTRGGVLDGNGVVMFDRPMRTNEISIFFLDRLPARSQDPYTNGWQLLPLAVGEVTALPDPAASPVNLDRRVELPCGSGPTLEAGGTKIQTRISATLRDLVELREVQAVMCPSAGAGKVGLPAGETRIVATSSPITAPTRVAMTAESTAAAKTESRVDILAWLPVERRLMAVSSPQPRVLVVRENINAGWKATMGGLTLPAIVLDGWQQGWYVAAGLGGEIVLTYEPDSTFRAAIFGGGGLAAALIVVAFLPGGQRIGVHEMRPRKRSRRWIALAVGALGLAVTGGLWAALIAAAVLLSIAAYRLVRWKVSKLDRRRVRLTVAWLRNWLPPLLVCLAGFASWRSPQRALDLVPQALALGALVILWLSMMTRSVPAVAAKSREKLQRPLDEVVARGAKDQSEGQHHQEGAQQVAGEDRAGPGPVDKRDYEWVP